MSFLRKRRITTYVFTDTRNDRVLEGFWDSSFKLYIRSMIRYETDTESTEVQGKAVRGDKNMAYLLTYRLEGS